MTYKTRGSNYAANDDDHALMCQADGCPNRWSVDKGDGKLCSAHAWVEPHKWPEITARQLHEQTNRARIASNPRPAVRRYTADEKRAILRKLLDVRTRQPKPSRDWAYALKAKHEAGEPLTEAQRTMWKAAVGRGAEESDEQCQP